MDTPHIISRCRDPRFALAIMAIAVAAAGCSSPDSSSSATDAGAAASGDASVDGGSCDRTLPTCPSTPPSFQQTVSPIIASQCAGCHSPGSTHTHLDLSTYANIYATRGAVLDQVDDCMMPPSIKPPLTADERTTVMTWLVCGAPNN